MRAKLTPKRRLGLVGVAALAGVVLLLGSAAAMKDIAPVVRNELTTLSNDTPHDRNSASSSHPGDTHLGVGGGGPPEADIAAVLAAIPAHPERIGRPVQTSAKGAGNGRSFVFVRSEPADAAAFYQAELLRAGWQKIDASPRQIVSEAKLDGTQRTALTQVFTRGQYHLEVSVTSEPSKSPADFTSRVGVAVVRGTPRP